MSASADFDLWLKRALLEGRLRDVSNYATTDEDGVIDWNGDFLFGMFVAWEALTRS